MSDESAADLVLQSLQERAKELNCLFEVEEILVRLAGSREAMFAALVEALPAGWQYPSLCLVRIEVGDEVYCSDGFRFTPWNLGVDILEDGESLGRIDICYSESRPPADEGPFLKEESRLIATIAERLGHYLQHQKLKQIFAELKRAEGAGGGPPPDEWRGAVHLLRATDPELCMRLARRMVRHLCLAGIKEAQEALEKDSAEEDLGRAGADLGSSPERKRPLYLGYYLSDAPFEMAARHLDDTEILESLQRWMLEEKSSFLIRALENRETNLLEVTNALRRFHQRTRSDIGLSDPILKGLRVALIRRFLTDELPVIGTIKEHLRVADFVEIADKMICPAGGRGKVGGKTAGVFVAKHVLARCDQPAPGDLPLAFPRSWYVASDGLSDFVDYNDLHEWVLEQKYKQVDQVREEYPLLVQLFKNARFSPEMVMGLSMALDDFQECPLIVRSSSLGEDRTGNSFSGKYKSLFLPNTGPKRQRLEALLDAVAEVYASSFGPEPIEYRRERGLLDFDEEMAILLQEVVGVRVGRYFLPSFAGVAFSNNEFRWSPRIDRSDGLLRLVPGLGTRAVDRLGDDYPVLIAPGKPGLRSGVSVQERVRYSPRMIDVIDLEHNEFTTMELATLLREPGFAYPGFEKVFSVLSHGSLARTSSLLFDPDQDEPVVTFEGLLQDTAFTGQMRRILQTLQNELDTPVDLEFASDGQSLYLLQCRAQSYSKEWAPAAIPRAVPADDVVFRTRHYVSNGTVAGISHLVYVDPCGYAQLCRADDMKAVARAVGRLNACLPKREFVLLGPGRWGSRSDLKLGVSVSYSDINNTALLVEIARENDGYLPDLSFGTHFFQDLVESSIRYLPLFPDRDDSVLNENFIMGAPNLLSSLVPEHAQLSPVLRVVDVRQASGGRLLDVFMNGTEQEAVAVLCPA
jgi:pyruvate, water dikinase